MRGVQSLECKLLSGKWALPAPPLAMDHASFQAIRKVCNTRKANLHINLREYQIFNGDVASISGPQNGLLGY